MSKKLKMKLLTLALVSVLVVLSPETGVVVAETPPKGVRIFGLVRKPLSVTYAELLSFPMVSEIATLECVDRTWKITLNWTGVPLFHLLTLAQVEPEAYDVLFKATDGYTSSIKIEEALKPTTILALKANGTLLSEISGREGGFRIVVPCKWGYKWVANVEEIEVRAHTRGASEHKGMWEDIGYPDEADMPNCTLPSITPPLQILCVPFAKGEFQVEAFTNISINEFFFNYLQKEMIFNITVPSGKTGFADFVIQQDMLKGPYSVFLDEKTVDTVEVNVTRLAFLYVPFPEGFHTLKIVGTEFFGLVPKVIVEFNQTAYVGEPVIFDASKSVDDGKIVSYQWDFGDGNNGSGAIASHSYTKEETYWVVLNVTDNDGFSNLVTLTVSVEKQIGYITIIRIVSIVSAVTICALAITLIILLLRRKNKTGNENRPL